MVVGEKMVRTSEWCVIQKLTRSHDVKGERGEGQNTKNRAKRKPHRYRLSFSFPSTWIETNTHPGVNFYLLVDIYEAGKVARPIGSPPLGMDGDPDWQKIRTHGFDWLN